MAGHIDFSWEDILPDGELPGDVMVSILSNLPVKSLLKFKAVSKPWHSLMSSPRFIKMHRRRQSLISSRLLMWFGEDFIFGLVSNNHDKNNTSSDSDVLIIESPILSSAEAELYAFILDSCNGLVFMSCSGSLILWNPATRKRRSLELPKGGYRLWFMTLGLCYVEDTSDFKIVGWNHPRSPSPVDRSYLFVYSLRSDSWEKLDYDVKKVPVDIKRPTFMSGCMHWLINTGGSVYVIVAYNVTDGVISCFGVADDCVRRRRSKIVMLTLAIRGCLSIVILYDFDTEPLMESKFEVWVMEEYGVEGSWVKRFTFQWLSQRVMIPLISWNDREIVFIGKKKDPAIGVLTFYDPYSKKKYCFEFKSFYINQVFNYVESLASVEGGRRL